MIKPALTRVVNVSIRPTSAPLVDIKVVSVVDQVKENAVEPLAAAVTLVVTPQPVVNMVAPRRWTRPDAHPKLEPKMDAVLVSHAHAKWLKTITTEPDNTEPKFETLVPTNQWIIASLVLSALVNHDLVML